MAHLVGTTLGDRYRIERLAGAGGMGTVYRARHVTSELPVALKVLRPGLGDASRFAREVVALSKLEHPGIVRYLDHGFTEHDEPYLVMEWLEGVDLAKRIEQGPVSLAEALGVARAVASTIGVLHEYGIVHRDVKPANLFLVDGRLDSVKLLDFGIARIHAGTFTATGTGSILGTPAYMAPEQARGERNVDSRVDVFALGCVLYECLTGKPPFSGDSPIAVLAKVVFENPVPLRDVLPEAPRGLEALLTRLLAKDPAERPTDGKALAAAIESAWRDDARPADEPAAAAVTTAELRVVSLVLADAPAAVAETLAAPPSSASDKSLFSTVLASGGRIVRLAGGAVLASFSGSGSPKDLAERAAACALEWRATLGPRAVVVATGRAALVARLPVGEAIDAASALARDPATSEGVVVDETTAALLEGGPFELAARGPRRMLVGRRQAPATRELLGRPVPCVGRERELGLLSSIFDECVGEPLARAVLLVAPPGTGKSRLVEEFTRALAARHPELRLIDARLDAIHAGSPFGIVSRLVRRLAALEAAGSPQQRFTALRAAVHKRIGAASAGRVASFLGGIVGADGGVETDPAAVAAQRDPGLFAEGVRSACLEWFGAETKRAPLVLLLEDLHWGDVPSVRLIDMLLDRLAEQPLLVLATARPEVETVFPSLWSDRALQEIRLGTLNRRACTRLIRGILPDASDEVVEAVVKRAAGHPFYLEELVRAVAAGASPEVLPDSVLGMLQARLDGLGDEPKRVLRAASVFGQGFHEEGVRALFPDGQGVGAVLEQLVAKEVFERRPGASDGRGAEFAFRHALVRDAAYAMLPEGDRARAHAAVSAWLERVGEREALIIADHAARGGAPERAAHWFARAAQNALDANDFEGSRAAVERGLGLDPPTEVRAALELVGAFAAYWSGELARARPLAERAFAALVPGSSAYLRAAMLLVTCAGQLGDNAAVHRTASAAAETDPDADAIGELATLLARASSQLLFGAHADAKLHYQRLLQIAPDPDAFDARTAGYVHRARGEFAYIVELDFVGALGAIDAATAAFDRAGAPADAAMVSIFGAVWRTFLGDHEGLEVLDSRLRELERGKPTYVLHFCRMEYGLAKVMAGRFEGAVELLETAATALASSTRLSFHAHHGLSIAHLQERRFEDAIREGMVAAAKPVNPKLKQVALASITLAQLELGQIAAAAANAQALSWSIPDGAGEAFEEYIPLAAGRAHRAAGDVDRARESVRAGLAFLERHASRVPPRFRAVFMSHAQNAALVTLSRELGFPEG